MSRRLSVYTGWAIGHSNGGFMGRYTWFYGQAPSIPLQFEGHTTALFRTRKLARMAARGKMKSPVVKVQVTIEEVPR